MAHNDFHGVYNQDVDRPSCAAGDKLEDTSTGQSALPKSGRDSASGEQRCNIKMEPSERTSEVSYTSARLRVGKRKLDAEVSSSVSGPPVSSDGTIQYEVPPGADISLERAPEEADKLLALFLELRGIARSAVRDTGLGFYFNAYGYGTPSERQDIMPQIEQELHECSMLKLVQFFRYFLCSDDFEAFASKLYDWIQAAQPKSNEALSAGTEEPDNQSEPLHYLDRDKLQLLQMFRCLLESEARRSCTPFERRLRAELLEQALMPAEAEQVAGLIYDSLLPAEVDAWNRKLHEESVDAYWMPS